MLALRGFVLSWFVFFIYRALVASWRITVVESAGLQKRLAEGGNVVFAHWHGDELSLIYLVKRYKLATMTSTSGDGAIIDFAIRKFGGATARGSSTRGAITALKGLIRLVREGRNASVAVDGPRGPIYQPKPGVFEISLLTDAPIVPAGVVASFTHLFHKSWNKTFLPLPFSKVCVYLGEPQPLLKDRAEAKDPQQAQNLKQAIDAARREAAKIIAAQ